MTREEAYKYGLEWLKDEYSLNAEDREFIKIAIEELKQQPYGDCISREAALDAMCALCNTGETLKENPWRDNPHIDAIIDALDNLLPITPQPKTGRWTRELVRNEYGGCIGAKMICSECGQDNGCDKRMKFCPNCGCRMIDPQESEG